MPEPPAIDHLTEAVQEGSTAFVKALEDAGFRLCFPDETRVMSDTLAQLIQAAGPNPDGKPEEIADKAARLDRVRVILDRLNGEQR